MQITLWKVFAWAMFGLGLVLLVAFAATFGVTSGLFGGMIACVVAAAATAIANTP